MNPKPVRVGIIGLGEVGQLHAWVIRGWQLPDPEPPSPPAIGLLRGGRRLVWRLLGDRGRYLARRVRGRQQQATPTEPPPPVPPIPPGPGIDGVQIAAAADADGQRLAWFAQTFGISQTHRDYRELIARPDVDAVFVCTPPTSHREITIEAARQGKHIFCEKPMAMTSADCLPMIDAAREAAVVLQIGYVLRFSSDRDHIRDAIVNNAIGRPVFLQEIMSPRAGSPQRWVHDERLGGSVLWEYSHGLDFLRHVFGDPDSVFALGGRYKPDDTSAMDTIAVLLTFPSGDKALFTDSYAIGGFGWDRIGCRPERLRIDVMGPRGFIQYPDADLSTTLTLCTYDGSADRVRKIPWRSFWGANGYRAELEHFFTCVREGKPSDVPGEEGLRTAQLLETVMRSMQTGEVCRFGG